MIVGNINDAERYFSVNKNFKSVFEFLKTLNPNSEGKFEFDGFRGFITQLNTSDFDSNGNKKRLLEAHKKYIDIHYVIEGSDGLDYANINTLAPETVYDEKDDYIMLSGKSDRIILNKEDFCVVFPEDAHMFGMKGNDDSVKKAIVKIKL